MSIKIFIKTILRVVGLEVFFALAKKNSALKEVGWFKSFNTKQSINLHGKPIPWMTYPFLEFVEKRLNNSMKVFEYGSGNSTLWWADQVKQVISCEHDLSWFQQVEKEIPINVEIYHCDLSDGSKYSEFVSRYNKLFDIIVIDGRQRVSCVKNSLSALTDEGVVIWDNSDRNSYNEGYDFLKKNSFKRIDFWGMGPINSYSWCTSVFYREDNVLGL